MKNIWVIIISLIILFSIVPHLRVIRNVEGRVVSWYNCIVILPDGSISETTEPVQRFDDTYTLENNTLIENTQPIHRIGDTYTLTDNIYNYTILVHNNNIILDGANFTLQGDNKEGTGVFVSRSSNITIKNIQVTRYGIGIKIVNSMNCKIINNIFGNPYNRFADANSNGISIETKSIENLVANNLLQDGGILIKESYNNTFQENRLYNSGFQIGPYIGSEELKDYQNNIDSSNLINDAPTLFLLNQTNLILHSIQKLVFWH